MSFTHLDDAGHARMVDVTAKQPTVRSATARGFVRCSPEVIAALRDGSAPKGDVLAVARIAGIQAAKSTPALLPLAHVIGVHAASVDLVVTDDGEVKAIVVEKNLDRYTIAVALIWAASIVGLGLLLKP